MASCTQVEGLLQAFVDNELTPAERLVLEQHIIECERCARVLLTHKRCAATLFESFEADRLERDLTGSIMQHLPEMAPVPFDSLGTNWRVKHPHVWASWLARTGPVAAAAVILVLAALLTRYWPDRTPGVSAIGVVTQSAGAVQRIEASGTEREPVRVKEFVKSEERYETGDGSTLMVLLAGRTAVKLNQNTRVRVLDERRVGLEKGRIWLDVGADARLFRVVTPAGEVTVFGTVFDVEVSGKDAVVTVARGHVQVENDRTFCLVEPDEQVRVTVGAPHLERQRADAARELAWANAIEPDAEARGIFESLMHERGERLEIPAERVFVVSTQQGDRRLELDSLRLEWEASPYAEALCSYDVYVSDQTLRPLFKTRIDGATLAAPDRRWLDVEIDGNVRDVQVYHVKIVPDFGAGHEEADFVQVYGIGH